jgi:hypothetical protein
MNPIATSFATIVGILFASTASAALLVYEPFPYGNGNLDGNTNATAPSTLNGFSDTNKWTVNSATPGTVKVIDGDLTFSGLPTTTTNHMAQLRAANLNPVRVGIGEYPEGSTVYFSLLLEVPSDPATYGSSNTTGSFLAGFQFYPSSASTSTTMESTTAGVGGALTIRRVGSTAPGTGYNLGIAFRDIPAATSRVFDTAHEFRGGETVFVVGRYEIKTGSQNDVASLYLNRNPTGPEPTVADVVSDASVILAGTTTNYDYMWDNTGGQIDTAIRSFLLRSNGVEPSNINIDEIRIGSSWEEVTGQVVVPEPATLRMLAVAVAALLARQHRGG